MRGRGSSTLHQSQYTRCRARPSLTDRLRVFHSNQGKKIIARRMRERKRTSEKLHPVSACFMVHRCGIRATGLAHLQAPVSLN